MLFYIGNTNGMHQSPVRAKGRGTSVIIEKKNSMSITAWELYEPIIDSNLFICALRGGWGTYNLRGIRKIKYRLT